MTPANRKVLEPDELRATDPSPAAVPEVTVAVIVQDPAPRSAFGVKVVVAPFAGAKDPQGELQVMSAPVTGCPNASLTVAVTTMVPPGETDVEDGEMVTKNGVAGRMVTVALAVTPP